MALNMKYYNMTVLSVCVCVRVCVRVYAVHTESCLNMFCCMWVPVFHMCDPYSVAAIQEVAIVQSEWPSATCKSNLGGSLWSGVLGGRQNGQLHVCFCISPTPFVRANESRMKASQSGIHWLTILTVNPQWSLISAGFDWTKGNEGFKNAPISCFQWPQGERGHYRDINWCGNANKHTLSWTQHHVCFQRHL